MLSKLFYRILILGFVFLLFSPFILKDSEGRPLMTFEEFMSFDTAFIKNSYRAAANILRGIKEQVEIDSTNETKLYKWKDENGEWNFGDVTPDRYKGEEIKINHNRNVLNFGDIAKALASGDDETLTNEVKSNQNLQEKGVEEKKSEGGAGGYIKKMTGTLDGAKNVQNLLDKNHQDKVKAMDGI